MEVFNALHEHLLSDTTNFWTRSNFYVVVESALIAVYGDGLGQLAGSLASRLVIAGVGLLLTVFWWLAAHGSILWIRRWRTELARLDRVVDRHRAFELTEDFADQSPLWSPSNVTQYLPILFAAAWILLVVSSLLR